MDIIALANTVLFENLISGGDVILPQIKKCWGDKFNFELITGRQGKKLWAGLGVNTKFHLVKYTLFDRWPKYALIPLLYIIRTYYATVLLNGLLRNKTGKRIIIYSSSDFFPDVIPVFIMKLKYKNIIWLSRIYHVILSPLKRKGNPFFNFLSYFGQRLSFHLIRRKSDLVVPLEGTDKELIDIGFKSQNIFVSNAGIDLGLIESVDYPQIQYDCVYVGTLTYTKGVYDLLRIWKEVVAKKPDAKLAIAGGGSSRDMNRYRQAIINNNLHNNVDYLGYIPSNEDVYQLMKASRIFVYAGHESGWSLTMAEAMACRIPVVSYKLSMFETAFKSGFIAVPLYDTKLFAREIIYLLNSQEERIKIGRLGYEESRAFGWDKVAADLSEKIDTVALF